MTLRKVVVSARNATLHNADGTIHTDLFGANGTLLLGHSNPAVIRTLAAQNEKVWITGRLDTDTRLLATELVEGMIPDSHYVSGFYSTGMEAAEFALRAARVLTARKDVIGFSKAMHGKSSPLPFSPGRIPTVTSFRGLRDYLSQVATTRPLRLSNLKPCLLKGPSRPCFLKRFRAAEAATWWTQTSAVR